MKIVTLINRTFDSEVVIMLWCRSSRYYPTAAQDVPLDPYLTLNRLLRSAYC